MIGKLHMTTLFGPRESAGSSFATAGSGVGENQPACTGVPGSETSMACSPPECQESKIRSRSTVGLCDEYEVNSFSPGTGTAEWLSAQPEAVWPGQCGPVPQVGNRTGVSRSSFRLSTVPVGTWSFATLLVSRTPKPPRR